MSGCLYSDSISNIRPLAPTYRNLSYWWLSGFSFNEFHRNLQEVILIFYLISAMLSLTCLIVKPLVTFLWLDHSCHKPGEEGSSKQPSESQSWSQAIKITFRPSLGLDMKLSCSFSRFSVPSVSVRSEYTLGWSAVLVRFLCCRLNSLNIFCRCSPPQPSIKKT